MNHKAQGPNGQPVGFPGQDATPGPEADSSAPSPGDVPIRPNGDSLLDDQLIADLVIAYDEALRTGTVLPVEVAESDELDPNLRERLKSAKGCLDLIERVRLYRQSATEELLPRSGKALFHDHAYT